MSPIPEAKTGAPNIQDVFLNYARREKLPVTVHLLDGREFEARIKNFDRFALIVAHILRIGLYKTTIEDAAGQTFVIIGFDCFEIMDRDSGLIADFA